MSSLSTKPHPELAFDDDTFADTEVLNPAIALIDRRQYLGLLLAKNSIIEPDGTLLQAVRWIRLPLRWRLTTTRLLSRIMAVRLLDEWLFNDVFLGLASNGQFVAQPHRRARRRIVLPHPSEFPYPCKPLAAGHYHRLLSAPGRLLSAQVVAMFHEHLGLDGERAALAWPPPYPRGPLPWKLFAG